MKVLVPIALVIVLLPSVGIAQDRVDYGSDFTPTRHTLPQRVPMQEPVIGPAVGDFRVADIDSFIEARMAASSTLSAPRTRTGLWDRKISVACLSWSERKEGEGEGSRSFAQSEQMRLQPTSHRFKVRTTSPFFT